MVKQILKQERRLYEEEMGFEVELFNFDSFIYSIFENGLIEHEFDHVLVGRFMNYQLIKNKVNDYKWITFDKLQRKRSIQSLKIIQFGLELFLKNINYL